MVASFSISGRFTAKLELVFVLTQENAFHFKANRKSIAFLKKWCQGIFKIAFRLRDRHVFMRQSLEILNLFSTLRGHSIITFALRGGGGIPHNANKSERGGGGVLA